MEEKFLLPGRDGEFDPSANIWRKGIVFTNRAEMPRLPVKPGYRVSVALKRGVFAAQPLAGFRELYKRVAFLGKQRVSELTLSDPSLAGVIVCHGWRLLGDAGNMATAFMTLALQEGENEFAGEQPPTDEDLRGPGGSSFADVARVAPQRAEELYNEFDFTDSLAPSSDPITVSYAEAIPESPEGDSTNFKPIVERAETFANSYYNLLKRFGEVNSPFRTKDREWFLADRRLATVHICFSR
jgi:hypothetical protein